MKKLLSIVLTICLMLTFTPLGVFNLTANAFTSGYYTYTVSNGKATITDCDTTLSGNVVIPDTLGGYPVTSIGEKAFYNCSRLTRITIPDSVTSIGYSAFQYCSKLTSINIPDGVTSIGYSAFSSCSSLTSINIPDGVTSIGTYAFYGCSKLTSITVDENNTHYCSVDGVLFDKNKTTLIRYPEGKPNSEYTIPDSVTSIGISAFNNCANLTNIKIPDSVTSIGYSAFSSCSSLTSITIGKGVTSIGGEAFSRCSSLTSINIPDSVTSIGYRAFSSCSSLTSITIPDSVTSIGGEAFSYCISLENVYITDIAKWCAIDFADLYASPLYYAENLYLNNELVTELVIPNGVTSIGNSAFYDCSKLTNVTIPDSVTSIGDYAFRYCSSLTSITVDENNTEYCSVDGVLFDKNKTTLIQYPVSKTNSEYTIPDSVTSIGGGAFCGCSKLTSINIPDGVTSIGNSAFSGCSKLTSINIPDGVTSIGGGAFSACSNLISITLPDGVTSIGDWAFYNCSSLKNVYYTGTEAQKENITIASSNDPLLYAMWYCNSCIGSATHTYDNNCDTECNVCSSTREAPHTYDDNCDAECNVCSGTREVPHTYDNACDTECNVCSSTREAPHSYEWIIDTPENCGKNGSKHEECSVCHIKKNENTIIPATGNHAFEWIIDTPENCGKNGSKHEECSLCHIKRNENTIISATGNHSYDNNYDAECNVCSNTRYYTYTVSNEEAKITSCDTTLSGNVVIPDTLGGYPVTSIKYTAFSGCTNLTSITIPESVTSIGDGAFEDCSSLKRVYYTGTKTQKENIEIGSFNDPFTNATWYYNSCIAKATHTYSDACDTECNVCSFTREAPHSFEWIIDTPVNCVKDGLKHEECSLCHIKRNENTIIPATEDHPYDSTCDRCGCYTYTISSGKAIITSFDTALSGSLVILDTLGGYPVTSIKYTAFKGCTNLTSITIPDGVTSIGDGAFEDCTNLASITIPESVTSIGDGAFSGCTSLEKVYYGGTETQKESITIGSSNELLTNATWIYINCIPISFNGKEENVQWDEENKPILPKGYTDEQNKHFAIVGWTDKDGNEIDTSTLTVDNMVPLAAVVAEIPVDPTMLEADLIPTNDPYLPTGNKYINGFYVQGTQIRIPSSDDGIVMGLRFVNILDNNLLGALKEGATDISYGTLVMLKKYHDGTDVTLDTQNVTKVSGENTFKRASEFNNQYLKYTVAITGITEEYFTEKFIIRPYITFTYNGNVVTLYGEQYEDASLYSAAKLAVAPDSIEDQNAKSWIQENIVAVVEKPGDNDVPSDDVFA